MAKQQRQPGSWGPLPLAVMQDERLTTADKAIYAALVVVAHGRPECEISRPVLSRLSSTSISTVTRSLSNLEGSGWVNLVTAPGRLTVASLPRQGDTTTPIEIKGVSQLPYTGLTVTQGSSTVNGSGVTAESDANAHREERVENKEAVANAPFGDEDRKLAEQRFVALRTLMEMTLKRFAKPTVSPIPHSENPSPSEDAPYIPLNAPIPGTPYHRIEGDPIVYSPEEAERRKNYTAPRAERPKPTAQGTW